MRVNPRDGEEEDEDDEEARLNTADAFFAALLANRSEFHHDGFFDQDALLTFFNSANGPGDVRMLRTINCWMDELLAEVDPDGHGLATCEASTSEELWTELQPFIAAVDPEETELQMPSLWPLIHHIEYGNM